jgi:hypothetical protein
VEQTDQSMVATEQPHGREKVSRLKAYQYVENRTLAIWQPGDRWLAEGVVRINLSALQRKLEQRQQGETKIAVEYGPEDWRILGETGANPNSMKIWSDQLLPFLWEEDDVRRYLTHWNYEVLLKERRERVKQMQEGKKSHQTETRREACFPAVWEAITGKVTEPVELMTREGRWFGLYQDKHFLYIREAQYMVPGCPITFDRKIRRKEVEQLLPLYDRWESTIEEKEIRNQARQLSVSYEYIFTIIRQYAIL